MTDLSATEQLEAMNRALRAQPGYTPDMRFVFFPEGADPDKASGYEWRCDPETPEKLLLLVQTAHKVQVNGNGAGID